MPASRRDFLRATVFGPIAAAVGIKLAPAGRVFQKVLKLQAMTASTAGVGRQSAPLTVAEVERAFSLNPGVFRLKYHGEFTVPKPDRI
jgi:hypothetical protein